MPKKTTLMDIAKACDVSVATVSYVLSHSDKESISHNTRLRITEMATKLSYVPHTKKTLDFKGKYVKIVICGKNDESYTKKLTNMDLAIELQLSLSKKQLSSSIIYTYNIQKDMPSIGQTNLIAVFLIDIDVTVSKKVTSNFIVPIIFIDSDTTDYIFHKIFPDYDYIYNKAIEIFNTFSLFIIVDDYCNQLIKSHISSNFLAKNIFVYKNRSNLKTFLNNHADYSGIVIGDLLGVLTQQYFDPSKLLVISNFENRNLLLPETKVMYIKNSDKAYYATEVLSSLIKMTSSKIKNNTIKIRPYI